ncbi:MAG: hypothetical protein AAB534_00750 [Patescibacteria group bacterium]
MATKKNTIDDIRSTELPAFRRIQWFETAKTTIQIFLMCILALSLLAFLILLIIAGVTQDVLPDIAGVRALSQLFVEIALNAKAVALFALGFFFREYLNNSKIAVK